LRTYVVFGQDLCSERFNTILCDRLLYRRQKINEVGMKVTILQTRQIMKVKIIKLVIMRYFHPVFLARIVTFIRNH